MRRILFEKTGNAIYISHLDLMRLFQRAFKRGGLNLKHTQGFSPGDGLHRPAHERGRGKPLRDPGL